ncbi:MAG TPA: adenine phosphoribosyltransferase [Ktedonobacterales bacterium]|jgi:adenine phosphoribosyltransferase|nr:adenine phosphoribosyltransferase [Ktedonobacterales bacterium]
MADTPLSRPRTTPAGALPPATPLPPEREAWLKGLIRDLPDFPQPGVLFRDITPLLQDAAGLRFTLETMAERYRGADISKVIGIESRGFLFGAPLAYLLGVGFTPVRKQGKLPAATMAVEYSLEYGSNVLEIHRDALQPGERALVVDDLLATGGTVAATVKLARQLGAEVVSAAFLIELSALHGRNLLPDLDVYTLLTY